MICPTTYIGRSIYTPIYNQGESIYSANVPHKAEYIIPMYWNVGTPEYITLGNRFC